MISQILFTLLFILFFLSLIFFCEILYKKFKIEAERTRQIAHVSASLFSLLFVFTYKSSLYVIVLGLVFFFLLLIGKRYHFFDSIEAVKRKTSGSILLPVSICSMFVFSDLFSEQRYFILPILIIGLSDPLASIAGSLFKSRTKNIYIFKQKLNKTYLGSTVFAISTFIISLVVLYFYNFSGFRWILISMLVTIVATIAEMLSVNGYDNLAVPHFVLLVLYFSDKM